MAMPKEEENNIVDLAAAAAAATATADTAVVAPEKIAEVVEVAEVEVIDEATEVIAEVADEVIDEATEVIAEVADEVIQEIQQQPAQDLAETQQTSVAVASKFEDPMAYLAEHGFTDLQLDFTSFPLVKLEDEKFQVSDGSTLGTEFSCHMIAERKQFVYIGTPADRGKDPEVVYSDDDLHQNGDERKPLVDFFQDWKSRGIPYERKIYKMVMAKFIAGGDGSLDDEVVMLQIPPKSIGKLDGYTVGLAMRKPKTNPFEVITRVSVGVKVGTGVKAFNPFAFKFIAMAD